MKLRPFAAALAGFAFLLSIRAPAQQTTPVAQFTDPANLRGERVKPRDGRELPIDQGARGLEQMLRRLNTRASLMLIVAHPDDEDGGMLTYYSRGLGARVAVLTLTRGEGGQNAMTGDFEDALGLLRTQELLSADRYLGVDQFFGTEVDFGFSKTKEEAFKKWTHERVLYDAVRAIRLYRPLVIAAVFIGGVTDGHGQHQVSGQIAQEAFKAAADPTVFPDMIAEGILPWQALKVYARVPMQSISDKGLFDYATGKYTAPRFENYVTGEITTTVPSSDVIVHEGTTDPILSDNPSDPQRTYVQFARIGLGMQKSQIGGGVRVPPAGAFDVAYHRYGSKLAKQPEHETSFFDGIDTSVLSLQEGHSLPTDQIRKFSLAIDYANQLFDHAAPEALAPALAKALNICNELIHLNEKSEADATKRENTLHELRIKRVQLNDALVLALGLQMRADIPLNKRDAWQDGAQPTQSEILPGSDLTVRIKLLAPAPSDFRVLSEHLKTVFGTTVDSEIMILDGDDLPGIRFPKEGIYVRPLPVKVPPTIQPTKPYFYRVGIEQPYYELWQSKFRNAPVTPVAVLAIGNISYHGAAIEMASAVSGPHVYSNGSDITEPLVIIPALSLSLTNQAQVLPNDKSEVTVGLQVNPASLIGVKATIITSHDWKVELQSLDSSGQAHYRVVAPVGNRHAVNLKAAAQLPDQPYDFYDGYRPIGYPSLPTTNYFFSAQDRIVPVDLNLPATHRIAYLPGTGDAVPEALASINLKPDILTVADLTLAKLAQYDTVVLGVRTYNAHPDLHGAPTQALLDYARNGGNVLVQYQTAEFTAADAPYPLTLGYSAEKVVDETDPVELLDPTAPFLTTPNKITPADFNNWVEERGHGFLESWDSHYTALTETHDPDQDPQRGGLITTQLGKGRWTYCAFALYRQLPEAVPGAYRLFVNLLSPGTTK